MKTECHLPHFTGEKHGREQVPYHSEHVSEVGHEQPPENHLDHKVSVRKDYLVIHCKEVKQSIEQQNSFLSAVGTFVCVFMYMYVYFYAEWASNKWRNSSGFT